MKSPERPPVRALLFDLGRVLIDIDFERALSHWARCAGVPPATLRGRFPFSDAYERHERGEIEPEGFFSNVAEALGIALSQEDWEAGWQALLLGEIGEVTRVVRSCHGRVPMYLFSNTNKLHADTWRSQHRELLLVFDALYLSHELGLRKPDATAFRAVVARMGVPAESVLFFDDTLENILGARSCGLQAIHVSDAGDVAAALERVWT